MFSIIMPLNEHCTETDCISIGKDFCGTRDINQSGVAPALKSAQTLALKMLIYNLVSYEKVCPFVASQLSCQSGDKAPEVLAEAQETSQLPERLSLKLLTATAFCGSGLTPCLSTSVRGPVFRVLQSDISSSSMLAQLFSDSLGQRKGDGYVRQMFGQTSPRRPGNINKSPILGPAVLCPYVFHVLRGHCTSQTA